jgi:hypothetical protein
MPARSCFSQARLASAGELVRIVLPAAARPEPPLDALPRGRLLLPQQRWPRTPPERRRARTHQAGRWCVRPCRHARAVAPLQPWHPVTGSAPHLPPERPSPSLVPPLRPRPPLPRPATLLRRCRRPPQAARLPRRPRVQARQPAPRSSPLRQRSRRLRALRCPRRPRARAPGATPRQSCRRSVRRPGRRRCCGARSRAGSAPPPAPAPPQGLGGSDEPYRLTQAWGGPALA